MDHRFARFRVTQPLARQSFDRFWIVLQSFDRRFQLSIVLLNLRDLRVQLQHHLPEPFILLNQWQIPQRHGEQSGDAKEKYYDARQLAPDA